MNAFYIIRPCWVFFYTLKVIGCKFMYSLCYGPSWLWLEDSFHWKWFCKITKYTFVYHYWERELLSIFSTDSMSSSLSTNTTSNGKMFSYNSCGVNVVHFVTVAPHVDTTSQKKSNIWWFNHVKGNDLLLFFMIAILDFDCWLDVI